MQNHHTCRICGSTSTRTFHFREMMFGLRERFEYFQCDACECLQIAAYPPDLSRYYPNDYYSFAEPTGGDAPLDTARQLRRTARDWLFGAFPGLWRLWLDTASTRAWLAGNTLVAKYTQWMTPASRILDVGCGSGTLLRQLRDIGFRRAEGIDPFIAADVFHRGERLVRKLHMTEVRETFDCVSMHHALEHMPDQKGVLREVRRILAPDGLAVIRIPVVGGEAWRSYRENWVQLDPPRHLYLHSLRSLERLARDTGFTVTSVEHDSASFQFWGSELYARDIPLLDPRSPAKTEQSIFTTAELAEFQRRAEAVNAARDGDQVIALLRPTAAA